MWHFSKKWWPFLNSDEQKKKDHQKNLEEMAKKYELMAPNKKGLHFFPATSILQKSSGKG